MLFLACKLSSRRSVLVTLAQQEVADNSSSTHTTTTQLQLFDFGMFEYFLLLERVSQVKLVICMQRGGPSGMFLLSA